MFNTIINRSTRSLARVELSDEQIRVQAPSVFATMPQAGVSERYLFLPTSTIVNRMRQEGWAPVGVQQQAVRLEGRMGFQKHLLRFQRRDQLARPGEYTAVIALVNSHDRSSAYQIHTALYRFICSNGLMVSDSTMEPVSIRHSGRETEEVISARFATWLGFRAVDDPQIFSAGVAGRFLRRTTTTAPDPRATAPIHLGDAIMIGGLVTCMYDTPKPR